MEQMVNYLIKKGKHDSGFHVHLTMENQLTADAILTDSCIYDLNDPQLQSDTNKLFGLSDNLYHEWDSARIGWRFYENKLEVMGYSRVDGQHYEQHLAFVEPNVSYRYSVKILDGEYQYWINDQCITHLRTSKYNFVRYWLYPYFGGTSVAPHDILIKLDHKSIIDR
jgi:hypothetical protein